MGNLFRETVLPTAVMMRGLADKLLTGITAEQFARKAVTHQGVIDSNHPAFCFGHLSLYPYRYIETLSLKGLTDTSEQYKKLFSAGAVCHDDATGDLYPPMAEIVQAFKLGYDTLLQRIETLDDEEVNVPNPNEGMRGRIPTLAGALNFLTTAHPAVHFGQVSAWRRAVGLGSISL